MTGAFVRIERDGKWENIEIEHLTKKEFKKHFDEHPDDKMKWLIFLHDYLGDLAHCLAE